MEKSAKIKIAAAAAAAYGLASMAYVRCKFHKIFKNSGNNDAISISYKDIKEEEHLERKKVTIISGLSNIAGHVYGKEGKEGKGLVIFCNRLGYRAEDNMYAARDIIKAGYKVFLFDYTGMGQSSGDVVCGFYQSVKDLNLVIKYFERTDMNVPIFLYGYGWGGYTVCAALKYFNNIAGVISVAGFNSPMGIVRQHGNKMMGRAFDIVLSPLAALYQRTVVGKDYNTSAIEGINSTDTPVLIIHGNDDRKVSINKASIISKRAKITNPNVEYYVEKREGHNGHSGMLYDREAAQYFNEKRNEFKMLKKIYYDKVPEQVEKHWYSKLDKKFANQTDDFSMSMITEFLDKAIKLI